MHKDEELILRFRDDCERSDPRKQYEMLFKDGDEVSMIGLKMEIAVQEEALLPMMRAKMTARTPKGMKQLKVTA